MHHISLLLIMCYSTLVYFSFCTKQLYRDSYCAMAYAGWEGGRVGKEVKNNYASVVKRVKTSIEAQLRSYTFCNWYH